MGWSTQVSGIRELVAAATNIREPNQSNDLSLSHADPSLWFNRRHTGIPMAAITQNGMLNQKIHLQSVFSEKAPPITGPIKDPIAHWRVIIANHFPRSLKVTMSETMTYVKATRPPPPMPCIQRPANKIAIFFAMEQIRVPSVKMKRAAKRTTFLPII